MAAKRLSEPIKDSCYNIWVREVNKWLPDKYRAVVYALVISNSLSVLLLVMRFVGSDSYRFYFLLWNLILAWLPLFFAYWLTRRLLKRSWNSVGNIVLTVLWLGFLPNSFYLISDLIHLQVTGEINVLYDVVLLMTFIFNGLIAGFMSVYLVHVQILKRLPHDYSHAIITAVLLLCSFAIYLGRNLRWNTWDVLVHPAGIVFDVSDRLINPIAYPQAFLTTATFFLMLGSMYLVAWSSIKALKQK